MRSLLSTVSVVFAATSSLALALPTQAESSSFMFAGANISIAHIQIGFPHQPPPECSLPPSKWIREDGQNHCEHWMSSLNRVELSSLKTEWKAQMGPYLQALDAWALEQSRTPGISNATLFQGKLASTSMKGTATEPLPPAINGCIGCCELCCSYYKAGLGLLHCCYPACGGPTPIMKPDKPKPVDPCSNQKEISMDCGP